MLYTAMNQYQNSLNALNRKKKKWSKKPFENRRKYLLDHLSKKKRKRKLFNDNGN